MKNGFQDESGCFDWSWCRAFCRWFLWLTLCDLRRIGDRGAANFRKGCESMNLAASWTHDVLCANSPNQQRIGNERAMATPRHRFGTHDCDPFLLGQPNQFFEVLRKLGRLHEIGRAHV